MPALVACRFNPQMKARYASHVEAGNPAKIAITAVMRRMIVLANALLHDDRIWAEKAPCV
ncbi:hypothetical protein A1351_06625 [Methylosinus sp. R-45379]|nr:hypothetical protein A1351_06625 [Methylosinus sp. R-45379]